MAYGLGGDDETTIADPAPLPATAGVARVAVAAVLVVAGAVVGFLLYRITNDDDTADRIDAGEATPADDDTAEADPDASDDEVTGGTPARRDEVTLRGNLLEASWSLEAAACRGALEIAGVRIGRHLVTSSRLSPWAGQMHSTDGTRVERWSQVGEGLMAFDTDVGFAARSSEGTVNVGDEVLLVAPHTEIPGVVTAVDGASVIVEMAESVDVNELGAPIGVGDGSGPVLVVTSSFGTTTVEAEAVTEADLAALPPGGLRPGACPDDNTAIAADQWASLAVPANQAAMLAQQLQNAIVLNDYETFNSIDTRGVRPPALEDLDQFGSNQLGTIVHIAPSAVGDDAWDVGLVTHELIGGDLTTVWFCLRWQIDLDTGRIDQQIHRRDPLNSRDDAEPGTRDPNSFYVLLRTTCV